MESSLLDGGSRIVLDAARCQALRNPCPAERLPDPSDPRLDG